MRLRLLSSAFMSPPGKSVRPQERRKSVSPVKSASPQMSVTPPGVWPGVSMTRKVSEPTCTVSPSP